MSKQYIFRVVGRNINSAMNVKTNIATIEENITIQAYETEYDLPNCLISLRPSKINRLLYIENIAFQGSDIVANDEITGYLKGHFGFTNEECITNARNYLKDLLNGNKPKSLKYSAVWLIFAEQFNEWFEYKLKSCLQKELELHTMYYNPD